MKTNNLSNQLQTVESLLQRHIPSAILRHLNTEWNKLKEMIKSCSGSEETPTPVSVALPAGSNDAFATKWQEYKEYLQEQHKLQLSSRTESARLTFLWEHCGGDNEKAIAWLDFYIRDGRYAGIFPLKDPPKTQSPKNSMEKMNSQLDEIARTI